MASSIYASIAEHVVDGRAPDLDEEAFRHWLSQIDQSGDSTWERLDDLLDVFVERFRALSEGT